MSHLDTIDLQTYLSMLMEAAKKNEEIPLDVSSNPIELNWDYYNWYRWIGEERYTEAHLTLCNLGYTFNPING